MNTRKVIAMAAALVLTSGLTRAHAEEKSRYMGGDVKLTEAPNGAVVNAD